MFKKLITAVGSAYAMVNEDFGSYLNGEAELSEQVYDNMWAAFMTEYKPEGTFRPFQTLSTRKTNFINTINRVVEHNKDNSSTFQKGINRYSDLTEEEFFEHFRLQDGVKAPQDCSATRGDGMSVAHSKFGDVPSSWDWRQHNGVTPVKNQGHCGSCWTFSTVGTLEAHALIKYDNFEPLSEQQLVDCAGDFDNHGCSGGLPSHAFEYIHYAGGISTEADYPYFAVDHNCTVKPDTFALGVNGGSVNITAGNETEMENAVYNHGPVSIAFQVVDGFRDYSSGVYSSKTCKNGASNVNHAVVAVGYGVEAGTPYWIVKNSWGADWGADGFFKIERGVNMCGVAECNSFPQEVVDLKAWNNLFLN